MSIGQSLDSIVLLRCAWQELQKMAGCSWISHHYSENFIQGVIQLCLCGI